MYFRITTDAVDLIEPENVRAFHAVVPADLTEAEVAASVDRAGLGDLLPGADHLMVRVEAIRRLAEGRVGPGWEDDLGGMLAYARSKGWTDDSGERVRAHVERD